MSSTLAIGTINFLKNLGVPRLPTAVAVGDWRAGILPGGTMENVNSEKGTIRPLSQVTPVDHDSGNLNNITSGGDIADIVEERMRWENMTRADYLEEKRETLPKDQFEKLQRYLTPENFSNLKTRMLEYVSNKQEVATAADVHDGARQCGSRNAIREGMKTYT